MVIFFSVFYIFFLQTQEKYYQITKTYVGVKIPPSFFPNKQYAIVSKSDLEENLNS